MRRHTQAKTVISLVLLMHLVLGMLPANASAASSAEIQKQINGLKAQNAEIQKEIDAVQRQFDENFSDMEAMVAEKNAIDREMTLINSKIEITNEQIRAYGQLIADTQEELEDAQEALQTLSEAHRERVRVMEEEGKLTYWEVLFEANSFTDLLDRINMIEEINEADRRRRQAPTGMLLQTRTQGHTVTPRLCACRRAPGSDTHVGFPEQVLLISHPTSCLWSLRWEGDSGYERNCL